MVYARYSGTAVDTAGNVLPNATVEVRLDVAGRPARQLYADRAGTQPLGNPIQADAQGRFGFYVRGGAYYIRIYTGPSQEPTRQYIDRHVAIGTAAERDTEDLAGMLEAGTPRFDNIEQLQAFTPSSPQVGAKINAGPDAGFYRYDEEAVEGERWVFERALFDTLARMNVTGGTANAIEAEIEAGVADSAVVMLVLTPIASNTGPVTINAIDLLAFDGAPLEAGWLQGGLPTFLFLNNDDKYQLAMDARYQFLADQAGAARDQSVESSELAEKWANNPQDVPVVAEQFSAKHHAFMAGGSASSAADSAGAAITAAGTATAAAGHAVDAKEAAEALYGDLAAVEQAKNTAVAAAEASGDVTPFDTKALADVGAADLPDGSIVAVWHDESTGGAYTKYTVQEGVLTGKVVITRPISTKAQAEAGENNDTDMGPLATRQAIDGLMPNSAQTFFQDTTPWAPGTRLAARETGAWDVLPSDATDEDISHPVSGIKLAAVPRGDGVLYVEQLGAKVGFDPADPAANNTKAAANTIAFQAALDACREKKISKVVAAGRGYAVNALTVHGGVTLSGATISQDNSHKQQRTVLFQPQSFVSAPLIQTTEEWGCVVENLHLLRTGTAGTLLRWGRGFHGVLRNIDAVGGDLGFDFERAQDCDFYNLKRSNGVRGAKMHANTNASRWYGLWIESCTGRPLEIGDAATSAGTVDCNGLQIFGLKLESVPSLASQLLYIRNVLGVYINGLCMPGTSALGTLASDFSIIDLSGFIEGLALDLLSGINNNPGAINSLIRMDLTAASRGISIRLAGRVTGLGSVEALVDYGPTMPNNSLIDTSGIETSGTAPGYDTEGTVLKQIAKWGIGVNYQQGNLIRFLNRIYGNELQTAHPMQSDARVHRWVSPDGAQIYEVRATNTGLVFSANGTAVATWLTNGKFRVRELELSDFPLKLVGGNTARTKAQLVAASPNPASFTGGIVRVTDATPANRLAYSDGTAWRYISDDVAVT